MFNGFKMSSFKCRSLVKEIIMPKNMFGCPLKLILGFFRIFCISGIKLKYSYTIMYDCEKSQLTHELSYIGLFNFSHLNLFHVNVICTKQFLKLLKSFFPTPTVNGPCGRKFNVCNLFQVVFKLFIVSICKQTLKLAWWL